MIPLRALAAPATLPEAQPSTRLEPWGIARGPELPRRREHAALLVGTFAAALFAAAYLIAAPPSADLAAATYRAQTFSRAGLVLWDNAWYGGHDLLAYSVLAPALSALLGARMLIALSAVIAAALFATIAEALFTSRAALLASVWFAVGLGAELLAGRVPYVLGLTFGLASLLAFQRKHLWAAVVLACASSLASPLAGGFLALAALAIAFADRRAVALAASALAPIALFAVAFPEGGYEPFAASAFWPEFAGLALLAIAVPRGWRMLRAGVVLYLMLELGAYVLHTPVGGNAERLGALFAGPLMAGALWERRRALLIVLAPLLLYWQVATPLGDLVKVSSDASVPAAYYRPLAAEVGRLSAGVPVRVEIPMTGAHWESSLVEAAASRRGYGIVLARGWERQLDTRYATLFYRSSVGAAAYRAWLEEDAVSYVALPNVRLDESALAEATLIRRGLPYLREVWRNPDWRLFAVLGARPLAATPAQMTSVGVDSFALHAPAAGAYVVRLRFSPYWKLSAGRGCVREASGGWTTVQARSAGAIRVGIAFSLARIFEHGARCN